MPEPDEDVPISGLRVGRWLSTDITVTISSSPGEATESPPAARGRALADETTMLLTIPSRRPSRPLGTLYPRPPVDRALPSHVWIILLVLALASVSVPLWSQLASDTGQQATSEPAPPAVPATEPYAPPSGSAATPSSPPADEPSAVDVPVDRYQSPAGPYQPPAAPGPAETPRRPSVKPVLTVGQSVIPATVDLSTEGAIDWMHWGLNNASTVNRKAGRTAITDRGGAGVRVRDTIHPQTMSWQDGSPTTTAFRTSAGVYVVGVGNGFELTVASGPTPRTLLLYAGVWKAAGRLAVSLSSGGPTATRSLANETFGETVRFTITFRTPTPGTLRIRWTTTESFDAVFGNVNLQAAALR